MRVDEERGDRGSDLLDTLLINIGLSRDVCPGGGHGDVGGEAGRGGTEAVEGQNLLYTLLMNYWFV